MRQVSFCRLDRSKACEVWAEALGHLPHPEKQFGPEWQERGWPCDERSWLIFAGSSRAGVVSLQAVSETQDVYRLCLLPQYQGLGLRWHVREFVITTAFADPTVQELWARVLVSNRAHFNERVEELREGVWEWGGLDEDPPLGIFVLRRANAGLAKQIGRLVISGCNSTPTPLVALAGTVQ